MNTSFSLIAGTVTELGQLQSALADYHVAYDLNPDNWETKTRLAMLHDNFGLKLFNSGQYGDALVEFSTALGTMEGWRRFTCTGSDSAKLGKLEDAYKDYLEVLRLTAHAAAQEALCSSARCQ